MTELALLEGGILDIIFQNKENGYTVLRLVTDEGEVVTAVGCLPCAAPGERISASGTWKTHPQHGEQFEVQSAERYMPHTEDEIISYLASGIIKGVGSATAERLVDAFGADTLDVIELEPERMTLIKGITSRKAMEISYEFRSQMSMRRLMEFMARYELPISLAIVLYRSYGEKAMQRVRENPYLLVNTRFGVDFAAADTIAIAMGFEGSEGFRVEAAVRFELEHNANNGHVFLPREKLVAATMQLLECGEEEVEKAIDDLAHAGAIVCRTVANVQACYLWRFYEAESYVLDKIKTMLSFAPDVGKNAEKIIDRIEKEEGITYAPQQRRAVTLAAEQGVMLLTGGPGTGKTTSVRGIVSLYEKMGYKVMLLAPTGRAAKRMSELCGKEAQTVHRALGMNYDETADEVIFAKDEKEPLEAEAVIVDEMSMVDLLLMRALLAALRPDCRLVMVGDADQLPSVGAGNVFSDLIRSRLVETVFLTEIFRQAQSSAIIRNAHAVNLGMQPSFESNQGDFFFMPRRDPARLVDTVVRLCATRLPENMGVPASEIQVLSPTRKGECGTVNLNRALQNALNPARPGKRERQWGDKLFRTGDRVMQTRNNYDVIWEKEDGTVGSGIFNGDVGHIEEIVPSGELFLIRFDDRTATYTSDLLNDLELAYAVTVHKSQGSEYRAVIFAAMPSAPSLMVRGVLYTALTRAREMLILVGDDAAVCRMAENDRQARRYSGLRWRLCHE